MGSENILGDFKMKKIYIYNNIEYDEIPSFYWPNSSPITEAFFILKGGRIEEREEAPVEEPEEPEEIRLSKLVILETIKILVGEKYFVQALKELELYEAWTAAQYIATSYPDFEEIVKSIKQKMIDLKEAELRAQGLAESSITLQLHSFAGTISIAYTQILDRGRLA